VPCIREFGAGGLGVVGDAGGDVLNWFDRGDAGQRGDLGGQRIGGEGVADVAVEFGDAAAVAVGVGK